MRFSLMTYTVAPSQPGGLQTLREMCAFAAEVGFEAMELSAGNLGEVSAREFAGICSDHGLAVSCLNGSANLADADEDEFLQGLDQARYYLDLVGQMNCPVLMIIPGRAVDAADKPRAAQRIADGLGQVVEWASEQGVFVTIEDFPNPLAPYCSISEVRWLLDSVPGLGLTFDNGNWIVGGDDPVKALKALGPKAINAHLKDWELDPERGHIETLDGRWIRGGVHGEGLLDQKAILSELKAQNYGGYLAFEYEGPLNHVEATRKGMRYLRSVLEEIGQ
ncbi:MAG: sugar phosphate isomerase/epimerase family protein [Armatimonadia bacterium]